MPLILPGNVASATAAVGYDVANSCRFNTPDSPDLTRACSTPTDNLKYTISFWFKRSLLSDDMYLMCARTDGNNYFHIRIKSDNYMYIWDVHSGGDPSYKLTTSRIFRDVSAWYHLVYVYDSANGTAGNRMRLYINGTEETSFSSDVNPAEDYASNMNKSGTDIVIGQMIDLDYFGGYMAEVCLVDGQALTPTSFGEFDSDSPTIWKPIDVSGLTFGNNGFYLDFEDSANLGNDANGGTDFTATNLDATDQATDTPTLNYCTLSSIGSGIDPPIFSEGNCYITNNGGSEHAVSTFAASNGRWYFEAKITVQNSNNAMIAGIADVYMSQKELAEAWLGMDAGQYGYVCYDGKIYNSDDGGTAHGDTMTTNDIIGVYVDLEDNKLYFAKNGVIQNSGTGYSITAAASTTGGAYHFVTGDYFTTTSNVDYAVNFGGCPAFAISSGNADANDYGNFEYDPSDGGSSSFDSSAKDFYALNSANLAEYG